MDTFRPSRRKAFVGPDPRDKRADRRPALTLVFARLLEQALLAPQAAGVAAERAAGAADGAGGFLHANALRHLRVAARARVGARGPQ